MSKNDEIKRIQDLASMGDNESGRLLIENKYKLKDSISRLRRKAFKDGIASASWAITAVLFQNGVLIDGDDTKRIVLTALAAVNTLICFSEVARDVSKESILEYEIEKLDNEITEERRKK